MTNVQTLLHWWKRSPPLATAEAFAALYVRTHVHVFRYVRGVHNGSLEQAEHIVAETFVRAWQARLRFQGDDDAALGWLLQIARRLVIDGHRRQQHRDHAPASALRDLPTADRLPDEHAISRDQLHVLHGQLARLPDDQRQMLVLRYLVGW
jgi:RNA polymerase sigma-70 factor (ECF subfamily)